ncbi:MAG: gliding motility-associated C-terminal domain-containing protein, partial [Bacteroidota bacterium]
TKEASKLKNFYTVPLEENLINTASLPGMSIAEGTLAISLFNDVIIDKVYYNENMHFPLLNSKKGVSYEKINLEKPSTQYSNWTSASENTGFATPTAKNSQDLTQKESDDVISLSAEFISPDNDGYQDVLEISYNLPETNLVGSLEVYDSKGRVVKTIFQNQLLGIKGSTIWDGITNSNEKANIGIYKFLLTTFDLNGKTKNYKKVFVIAGKL